MKDKSLHDFYQHTVLPQFSIKSVSIVWTGCQQTGPDEFAHYFKLNTVDYALIFEDYDGLGRNDDYIREHVLEHHASYAFVNPTSDTSKFPTYDGFRLPAPSQYCENVTGNFTLLKLLP